MGNIISAIAGAINSVISAIASFIMAIFSGESPLHLPPPVPASSVSYADSQVSPAFSSPSGTSSRVESAPAAVVGEEAQSSGWWDGKSSSL